MYRSSTVNGGGSDKMMRTSFSRDDHNYSEEKGKTQMSLEELYNFVENLNNSNLCGILFQYRK